MHDLLPISEAKAFDRILFWIRVNKWTTRPFTLLATASRYAWADTLSPLTPSWGSGAGLFECVWTVTDE